MCGRGRRNLRNGVADSESNAIRHGVATEPAGPRDWSTIRGSLESPIGLEQLRTPRPRAVGRSLSPDSSRRADVLRAGDRTTVRCAPSPVRGGRQPLLPLRRSSHRRRPATARALSRRRRLVRGEPAPRLVRPRVWRHTAAPPPGATFCAAGRPIGSGSGRRGRSVPGGHPGHPLGNASTEAGGRLAGGTYRSTAPTRCRHRHGPSLWTGKPPPPRPDPSRDRRPARRRRPRRSHGSVGGVADRDDFRSSWIRGGRSASSLLRPGHEWVTGSVGRNQRFRHTFRPTERL